MKDNSLYWVFRIRKRPVYIWLLRIVWVIWLVFWAEAALGSKAELEPKAFSISLVIFIVSLLAGVVLWLIGRSKFNKKKKLMLYR
ncbi:MAG: hypothetical protein ACOC5U_00945 [Candidatus Aminicenantaceae bacterium]